MAAWLGGGDAETVVDDPGGVGARFPDPGDETAMGSPGPDRFQAGAVAAAVGGW